MALLIKIYFRRISNRASFIPKKSWVLGMGWEKLYLIKILTKNIQFYEYLGMGMGWVDIPKPMPKTRDF